MKLEFDIESIESARRIYFAGVGQQKQVFLDTIASLPKGSPARRIAYLEMHRWLASCRAKPNHRALVATGHIAERRDWAFPLYSHQLLKTLTKVL